MQMCYVVDDSCLHRSVRSNSLVLLYQFEDEQGRIEREETSPQYIVSCRTQLPIDSTSKEEILQHMKDARAEVFEAVIDHAKGRHIVFYKKAIDFFILPKFDFENRPVYECLAKTTVFYVPVRGLFRVDEVFRVSDLQNRNPATMQIVDAQVTQ